MKDRGMILILYLKTCPDIGSPTKGSLPEKKAAYFWTLSKKGGGGFNPNPKVLGQFFLGLLLDITEERGGVEPIPKVFGQFLGSFEVVLRYFLGSFEVVFSCMFFVNLFRQKLPQGCPKRVGGGVKATFGQCPKVSGFFFRKTSLRAHCSLRCFRVADHSLPVAMQCCQVGPLYQTLV